MNKVFILLLITMPLLANKKNYIEIGAGNFKSKDNFSAYNKSIINSQDSTASYNTRLPYLEFLYTFEINKNKNIYTYFEFNKVLLAYELTKNNAIIDLGLKSILFEDEWENPFIISQNRKKTTVDKNAIFLGYGVYINKDIFSVLKIEYMKKNYKKENLDSKLKREGSEKKISLENYLQIDKGTLQTDLYYKVNNAKGKASTYKQYGLELKSERLISKNIQISFKANISKKDYKSTNPIFNKKVDSTTYVGNLFFKFLNTFNNKNVYTSIKTGYEKESANVKFYNRKNLFTFVSIGYSF